MTKAERQLAKRKDRVVRKLSNLVARRASQVNRRARLERIRKAFNDFQDGRITKTELRQRVPRSWLVYA
jgi:hypothetical protein